jgi:hypothetical protein
MKIPIGNIEPTTLRNRAEEERVSNTWYWTASTIIEYQARFSLVQLLILPNDLPETFRRAQTRCSVIVVHSDPRIGMVQNRTAKIGVRAAVDGGSRRRTGAKHMGTQFYAYGGKRGVPDHACQVFVAYKRAAFLAKPED